jgi:hypothetical protein
MTAQELAKLLFEELHADGWGDINPDALYYVANPEIGVVDRVTDDEDMLRDIEGLRKVLERVVARLPK